MGQWGRRGETQGREGGDKDRETVIEAELKQNKQGLDRDKAGPHNDPNNVLW